MATFKCDIKKQYGKFSGWAWKLPDRPGDPLCKDEATAAAVVDKVLAQLKTAGFSGGDDVIFRDTAYPSLVELKGVLSRAPY